MLFNESLLGKWLWCYSHERNALWRKVIEVKYGSKWGDGYEAQVRIRVWVWVRCGDLAIFEKVGSGGYVY